jgi:hypothetical protein
MRDVEEMESVEQAGKALSSGPLKESTEKIKGDVNGEEEESSVTAGPCLKRKAKGDSEEVEDEPMPARRSVRRKVEVDSDEED